MEEKPGFYGAFVKLPRSLLARLAPAPAVMERGKKGVQVVQITLDYTFSMGIFETVQRSLGLATSNCTIVMASVGQRTMHRPQRIHFSSSIIMSAPPRQVSVPRCMGSPLTTRERPSILIQS